MKTIEVEVTLEDIQTGVPRICHSCPVALAIMRATNEPAIVGQGCFAFERSFVSYYLPSEVGEFIDDFDAGRPVSPFTFTLEVPT